MRLPTIILIAVLIILLGLRIDTVTNAIPHPINIREQPIGDATLLGQFKQDDVYKVTRLLGDWFEIKYESLTAYTYRKELVVNSIVVQPVHLSIPVNLEYEEVPVILFSDTLDRGGQLHKKHVRIGLLVLGLLVFYQGRKKKRRNVQKQANTSVPERDTSAAGTDSQPAYRKEPTRIEKGNLFESYIVDKFPNKHYRLQEWTSDKTSSSGKWAVSNLNPDLKFLELSSNKEFCVECKYRRNDEVHIEERQLRRYRAIAAKTKIPVFLALGTGGKPNRPECLYLIPIHITKNVSDLNTIKNKYQKKDISKGLYFDPRTKKLL